MKFLLIIIDKSTGDESVYPYRFSYRTAADMEGEHQTRARQNFDYRVETVDEVDDSQPIC